MFKKPAMKIDNVSIYGNGHDVALQYFWGLSDKWQKIAKKEYNWINESDTMNWDEAQFFVHKNQLYCLSDFMAVHNQFYNPNPPQWMTGFDGYTNDSFYSGMLIKYNQDDSDYIKVYTYIVS